MTPHKAVLALCLTLMMMAVPTTEKNDERKRHRALVRLRSEIKREEEKWVRKEDLKEERRRVKQEAQARRMKAGFNVDASPADAARLPSLGRSRRVSPLEAARECEEDVRCGGFVCHHRWEEEDKGGIPKEANITFYRSVGNWMLDQAGAVKTRGWMTYRVRTDRVLLLF